MASILRACGQLLVTVFHFFTGHYFVTPPPPLPKFETTKKIIILGGSYGGIDAAHRILKNAPGLGGPVKVTLVTPNTHFYWNIAAPRAILPGQIPDEQIFVPIAPGFSQYPSKQFEFIIGTAESLNVEDKKVVVNGESGRIELEYDFLIIATGTRISERLPLKGLSSTKETKELLHEYQENIAKAKRIVVAGAGVTGVEVAGELGYEYGEQKEIILIAKESTVLSVAPPKVSKVAADALRNLNIQFKFETTVTEEHELPNGKQELTLSTGEILMADMYIPTFGLTPNSSFIPPRFLNTKGYATVDTNLNLKGTTDVWAIGDICDMEYSQLLSCNWQSGHAAQSVLAVLTGKTMPAYKPMAKRMMGLQIGKKTGTGFFGDWKVPGFIAVKLRKTLFIEMLQPLVSGSGIKSNIG